MHQNCVVGFAKGVGFRGRGRELGHRIVLPDWHVGHGEHRRAAHWELQKVEHIVRWTCFEVHILDWGGQYSNRGGIAGDWDAGQESPVAFIEKQGDCCRCLEADGVGDLLARRQRHVINIAGEVRCKRLEGRLPLSTQAQEGRN